MRSQRVADAPAITPERVLELKAEAKALKRTQGITQTTALARIAHREGFSSWEILMAKAGGRDVVDKAKHDRQPTEAQVRAAERRRQLFGDDNHG